MGNVETRTIKFRNVGCDQCEEFPIIGACWKCDVCRDYDLCTECYLSCMHSPEHSFVRFDAPGCAGTKVTSKQGSQKKQGRDVFAGANAEGATARGAIFKTIYCDACGQRDIVGTRWKCAVCFNYDLCTACHQGGKHNLDHVFLRIDVPGGTAVEVPPRRGAVKAEDVTFRGVNCDGCGKREIVGARWKCDQCIDYYLCTSCYMANTHNLGHVFWRFDAPGTEGLRVSPRNGLATVDDGAIVRKVVKFKGIYCDGCDRRGIVGTRWKCAVCFNYDLCSRCYCGGKHDLDHAFLRFDEPGARGVHVLPREASSNTHTHNGATSVGEEDGCEDRKTEGHARAWRGSPVRDHRGRDERATELRELLDTVLCAICMEGRRNVAFLCGHSACADCAKHLNVCHMCRLTITKKIILY